MLKVRLADDFALQLPQLLLARRRSPTKFGGAHASRSLCPNTLKEPRSRTANVVALAVDAFLKTYKKTRIGRHADRSVR